MVEGRRDYTHEEVEAARSVLVELGHIPAEYWEGIVVIGGWVPYFTVPQEIAPHEGTKDVDLALNPRTLGMAGYNSGGRDAVIVRVASIHAFLAMKGLALHNRGGDAGRKDAYDIYYCIKYFPEGIEGLAARFLRHLANPIVQEGLRKIAEKFTSMDHIGPQFIADRADDDEDRAFLRRDAYEQIHASLTRLGLKNS